MKYLQELLHPQEGIFIKNFRSLSHIAADYILNEFLFVSIKVRKKLFINPVIPL